MASYIDVEKACNEVDKGDLLVGNNADFAKEIIYRTPTTDVVEVKHGYWIPYSVTMMECSVCKRHTARHRYEFCPHCGSQMDGGKTE